ncbi:ABC transporter substrate-binding protein [Planomonospora corallina]|uniref:ABC transporter substrate-binding protein n=1 Tax=Planomonospora corallina TaxID=1806052 RepID=A0ABV8IDN3_9ACTN
MGKLSRKGAAAALIVASLAAACGGEDAGSAGTPERAAASGPVTLEFWGWAPGYDKSVELWNASHPDVKVVFNTVPSGGKGGYQKMFSAVKAGNAPCLAQVGFESVPTFLSEGALEDVSAHAAGAEGKFSDFSWNQVVYGGKVVGIPVDVGPQALFYRTDVFEKFEIDVPATWDEYRAAAEKLHRADPSYRIANLSTESYWFAGLVSQAGGTWFDIQGDSWKVGIDGEASRKVAAYWQDLADRDLVATDAPWSPEWFKGLASGKTATVPGAVWMTGILAENAKDSKGKWAVAPMPQWQAGGASFGNEGGSTTAVLKGCEHPREATEFATWMSTDPASLANLITVTGIYPAATAGLELPEANQEVEFFGGQKIYDVFKAAAAATDPGWKWGPIMTQTDATFQDAFGKALQGDGTLAEALAAVQRKVVADFTAKGLSVAAG